MNEIRPSKSRSAASALYSLACDAAAGEGRGADGLAPDAEFLGAPASCRRVLDGNCGSEPRAPRPAPRSAFTLIELLVVIAIIGVLASVGLPALKGFGQSNVIASAQRQMLDDVGIARQRAIAEHTDVYMVFMPPVNRTWVNSLGLPNGSPVWLQVSNLVQEQYTGYALYTFRSVGDQPGQKQGRYLQLNGKIWQSLPDGMFFKTNKFVTALWEDVSNFPTKKFRFPNASVTNEVSLPFIKFNYLGQLDSSENNLNNGSVVIPLARGSIFYNPDLSADPLENPRGNSSTNSTMYNWIRIDGLTGRARVERYEMK